MIAESPRSPPGDRRRELAARAAWLYYVGGATQDTIAERLGVSRAAAQRLVALAMAEHLVTVRLAQPIAACMELAHALTERFALDPCDVSPADPADPAATRRGLAIMAAERLERELLTKTPLILGVGSGRTMRAIVDELPALDQPQHRVVGLVGAIARDGSANPFEVVMRLADRIGAQRFPLPLPTVTESTAERELWQAQRGYGRVKALAERAQLSLVGVGQIAWDGPLHVDGFITDSELYALMREGAVGEILGWTFDAAGRLLEGAINERVTSVPLVPSGERRIVAVAGGEAKVEAMLGALRGRLVNGLLTDEGTARALLARADGPVGA